MPFIIIGRTTCCISGKLLQADDKIVAFPPFACDSNEAEFVCYEGVALREEFETWVLRNSITKRVKEFWVQSYHTTKAFRVITEDDDYLLVRSLAESKLRLFFLQHVFGIDIPRTNWREFCKQLGTAEMTTVIPLETGIVLSFAKEVDRVSLCLRIEEALGHDCIDLSPTEWLRLQTVLLAHATVSD